MAKDKSGSADKVYNGPPVPKRKKPRVHAAGHHGGAWKVAYADFITTLMALFLLLWLLSTSDSTSRAMLSLYFRDPGLFDTPQGKNMLPGSGAPSREAPAPILEMAGSGGEGRVRTENTAQWKELTWKLKSGLSSGSSKQGADVQVSMMASGDGIQIQIADTEKDSIFEPGGVNLTESGLRVAEDIATLLRPLPEMHVSIVGYSDSRPPLKHGSNQRDLSADRAQRIMQALVQHGVPPARMLEVAGYGDTFLLDPLNPLAPQNRRVVLTLKTRQPPTPDQRIWQELSKSNVPGTTRFVSPEAATQEGPAFPELDEKARFGPEGPALIPTPP